MSGLGPYYTVIVPWEPDPSKRTAWHPTTDTGPFRRLTRGAFESPEKAVAWAGEHLGCGTQWHVTRIEFFDLLTTEAM